MHVATGLAANTCTFTTHALSRCQNFAVGYSVVHWVRTGKAMCHCMLHHTFLHIESTCPVHVWCKPLFSLHCNSTITSCDTNARHRNVWTCMRQIPAGWRSPVTPGIAKGRSSAFQCFLPPGCIVSIILWSPAVSSAGLASAACHW